MGDMCARSILDSGDIEVLLINWLMGNFEHLWL